MVADLQPRAIEEADLLELLRGELADVHDRPAVTVLGVVVEAEAIAFAVDPEELELAAAAGEGVLRRRAMGAREAIQGLEAGGAQRGHARLEPGHVLRRYREVGVDGVVRTRSTTRNERRSGTRSGTPS